MKKATYLLILGVLACGLLALDAPAARSQCRVEPGIARVVQESRADDAYWSIVVRDSSGALLECYNHNKLVRPASNLKLLSSAAILDQLGSGFTYKTYMYGLGRQEQHTWKGDLIIRGAGDPSISGTFYEEDRFHVFEQFFRTLDSLGIRRIEGNLIGNDSYFDNQPYPEGWSWEDLSFYYGVEISALSFNENAVDLEVFADDKIGETPRIQWFPFETDYVEFINEQIIVPPQADYDEFYRRLLGTNTILLRSKLPQGYYETESLSIMNASLFFMDTFKQYLEDGGIGIGGQIIIDDQPKEWDHTRYRVLGVHESLPLGTL
ncbi:MAG: D-alanyl-D-alanine carboxypeptidase/D-alanyl-D-alanine-endopeptidase, partial [Balneolaceae bacterium]|nr:D-alanyl-D-alanine carboxypeptidase/D-alanyl-D-alanine-endopeptidase [Balneolaceae bacterium]